MLISKFANENIKDQVLEFEREHHIILHDQYKEFLSVYNGGYTPETKFKIGKVSSDIRGFYGIGDVKLSFNSIELEQWTEKGYLPIASDSFGNYIVIGLNNDRSGKIYFCDHEKGNRATCVADSLKEFLPHCRSEEISDEARLSIEEREAALIARGRGNVITNLLRQMWQEEIDLYADMIQEEVILE